MSPQKKRSLSYLMTSMFFGACMSVCITPYVLTTILREYNASVFQIALIPVLIRAGGFLALPIAITLSNLNCKKTCISLYSVGRVFIIVFLFVLVYPYFPKNSIPAVLLFSYAAMQVLGMSAAGPTNSWFKEIIPYNIQATFLGRRNALCSIITGCLTPAIGFLMKKHSDIGIDGKSFYTLLFCFAIAMGYIDMYILGKAESSSTIIKRKFRQIYRETQTIWKNRDIWNASTITVIANAGVFLVAPFMILLYYDLGLDKFGVGIVVALSTAGLAAGSITGGRFSDRLLLRKVFVTSSLLRTFCYLCFLILTIRTFSSGLPSISVFLALAIITPLSTFSAGCIAAANIKYIFNTVKGSSSIAFAFIAFITNVISLIILIFAAKFGSFLSVKSDVLEQHLWNGFQYTQILFLCSIVLSLLSCIYLRRKNLYKHIFSG